MSRDLIGYEHVDVNELTRGGAVCCIRCGALVLNVGAHDEWHVSVAHGLEHVRDAGKDKVDGSASGALKIGMRSVRHEFVLDHVSESGSAWCHTCGLHETMSVHTPRPEPYPVDGSVAQRLTVDPARAWQQNVAAGDHAVSDALRQIRETSQTLDRLNEAHVFELDEDDASEFGGRPCVHCGRQEDDGIHVAPWVAELTAADVGAEPESDVDTGELERQVRELKDKLAVAEAQLTELGNEVGTHRMARVRVRRLLGLPHDSSRDWINREPGGYRRNGLLVMLQERLADAAAALPAERTTDERSALDTGQQ